jgi:hypothetical protein
MHSNSASPQFSTALKWCMCALLRSLAPSRSPYYTKPRTSQQVARMYILQLVSFISNPSSFLIIFCSICLSLSTNDPGDVCFPSQQMTLAMRAFPLGKQHWRRNTQGHQSHLGNTCQSHTTSTTNSGTRQQFAFGSRTTIFSHIPSQTIPYGSLRINLMVRVQSGMMP